MEDLVAETALHELPPKVSLADRERIVSFVTRVTLKSIERLKEAGLVHDDDSVTWTPRFREIVARLLAEIMDANNPRLMTQCMDFAFNLGIQLGVSEQEIANQHGQTKSNVSKLCVGLTERYRVPPSRGMKSMESRQVFSLRQQGRRAKQQHEPWPHSALLLASFHAAA